MTHHQNESVSAQYIRESVQRDMAQLYLALGAPGEAPTPTLPTVRELQLALARHEAATTNAIVLGQRATLLDDSLRVAAKRPGAVGEAATAFLESRDALNRVLRKQMRDAQEEASTLASAFLTALFGQAVPGLVTLPSDTGMARISEHVSGLSGVHERDGVVSGVLTTKGADGRGSDTRSFYVRDGRAVFQEHVCL